MSPDRVRRVTVAPERFDEPGNVGHLAVRRGEQVRREGLKAAEDHVPVAVHEAGQQRPALQLEQLGLTAPMLHDLGKGSAQERLEALAQPVGECRANERPSTLAGIRAPARSVRKRTASRLP
jgi:hypothetical protein